MAIGDVVFASCINTNQSVNLQPSGSSVYMITIISAYNDGTHSAGANLIDTTNSNNSVSILSTTSNRVPVLVQGKIFISNSLYLQIWDSNNGIGNNVICSGIQVR